MVCQTKKKLTLSFDKGQRMAGMRMKNGIEPLRYKEVTDTKSVNELLAQNYRIVSISVRDGVPVVLMIKKN